MTKDDNHTSYNLRIPNILFEELKQFQITEASGLRRITSLHEIILKSIKDAIKGKNAQTT